MKADVIILGASGYGGGELLRLLSNHPAAGAIMPVSKATPANALPRFIPTCAIFQTSCFWENPTGERDRKNHRS